MRAVFKEGTPDHSMDFVAFSDQELSQYEPS